jgi:hypothetical protein
VAALWNPVRTKEFPHSFDHLRFRGGHTSKLQTSFLSNLQPVEHLVLKARAILVVATPKLSRNFLIPELPLQCKPRIADLTHSTSSLRFHSPTVSNAPCFKDGILQLLKSTCHSHQNRQVRNQTAKYRTISKIPLRLPFGSSGKIQGTVQWLKFTQISLMI